MLFWRLTMPFGLIHVPQKSRTLDVCGIFTHARGAVGRDWTNKMVLNGFKMGQIGGIRGLWRYQYAIVDCRLTVG